MDDNRAGCECAAARQRRERLVELASRYVEGRREYRTTVTEICQALGVGRRALEYAFRDVLRTSPKAYFTQRALHAAHRKLRASTPVDRTVTASRPSSVSGIWGGSQRRTAPRSARHRHARCAPCSSAARRRKIRRSPVIER
jgi:methylphosphotriester-DNA--protein-cysteine methyltransferase